MRIALVKRRYSLKVGGAERYCVNLARRLRSFGHDVTFIGESIDPELASEVNFVPITVNRLTSWTKNQSFAENTGRAVREGRFDVAYGLGRAFDLDAVRITDRLQSHWLNVYYRNSAHRALQRLNPQASHDDRSRADDLPFLKRSANRDAIAAGSRVCAPLLRHSRGKGPHDLSTASTPLSFIRECGKSGSRFAKSWGSSRCVR